MQSRAAELTIPGDVSEASEPITARLAGAGSLRRELEAVLAALPPDAPAQDYRRAILDENVAAKASATARSWTWLRLKLRYELDAPNSPAFRAFRSAWGIATSPADRGLIEALLFARTDRLFRELWLELVVPRLNTPGSQIESREAIEAVDLKRKEAGLNWSVKSIDRAGKHFLAALKDFDVLTGSRSKRTVRPQPGPAVTLFAATLAKLDGLTDRQTLSSVWFKLLGQDETGAAELLRTAASHGLLAFRMQADVVDINLTPVAAAG